MRALALILVAVGVGVSAASLWYAESYPGPVRGDALDSGTNNASGGHARPNEARPPRSVINADAPARIYVPRLGVASLVYRPSQLDRGPSWWPRTGRPGGGDTVAVAGHRTTHTRPFYYLDRLRPGDRVFVSWMGRTTEYRVTGNRILSARNLHIADARGKEVLLLSACTPRGSARYRLVVYAQPKEET